MFTIYISRRSHREIAAIIIIIISIEASSAFIHNNVTRNVLKWNENRRTNSHFSLFYFDETKVPRESYLYNEKITQLVFLFSNQFFSHCFCFCWVSDNLNVREMWNGQWVRHMAVAVFVRDLITSIMWFILFSGNLVKELRPRIHNFFALTRLELIFVAARDVWIVLHTPSTIQLTLDVRGKVVDEMFFFSFLFLKPSHCFRDTANRSDAVRCEPNVLLWVQPEFTHKIHNQMGSD